MDEVPYNSEHKDLRDLSTDIKLLIQHVNHINTKNSEVNERHAKNFECLTKRVDSLELNVGEIKTTIISTFSKINGISLSIKIMVTIVSIIATLIGIGEFFN